MKCVSVTSGKGGVGKSNVAINLALALADRGKRILLFDADLGLANVDILLGISCPYTVVDVLEGSLTLSEILVEPQPGLSVLPASSGILQLERLSPSQQTRLSGEMRELSKDFDLLLLDTGAGLTPNVLFFNASADEVLLVTTPEPTALTDAYAMIKVLVTSHNVETVTLLVNRVATLKQGGEVHTKLQSVCSRFLGRPLGYFGAVPHDSAVEQAVAQRKPVLLTQPQSRAGSAFSALANRFDEVFVAPARTGDGDLWSSLVSQTEPSP